MAINFKEEYLKCYQDRTRKYFIEHYLSTFSADEGREVPFKVLEEDIEIKNCSKLINISFIEQIENLQTISFENCPILEDISCLKNCIISFLYMISARKIMAYIL